MRLVFAGTPEAALPSLAALAASSHDLVAVVTRPDAPSGRRRRLTPSPVKARALELGLPVWTPPTARDPDFLARLRAAAPDACPVVAYGNLIPAAALAIPAYGWINLHFSLLPAWRGAAPVQHAILAGDEITGASTFRLEKGLDTGPVFGTLTETIRPGETSGMLLNRLADAGAALLLATLDGIESGRLAPITQAAHGVSLAPKITVEQAEIDFARPGFAVDRLIRACTPAPGAWTTIRGERLKLGPVIPDPAEPRLAPGVLRAAKSSVHVGTATDPVRLGEVHALGKRAMPAADWARGIRLREGERLGD